MKKKSLVLAMCVVLVMAFTACGDNDAASSAGASEPSATEDKSAQLEKEYQAIVDDYNKKIADKGESMLAEFNDGVSAYSKNSEGMKSFVGEKKNAIKGVYKEGVAAIDKVKEEYEDTDENANAWKGKLKESYKSAWRPIKEAYNAAYDKAVAAEKKEADSKAASKSDSGKSSNKSSKKSEKKTQSNYDIAKQYVGSDISSLQSKLGSPKSKSISNSCSDPNYPNGRDAVYKWSGVTVYAMSKDQNSAFIIQSVEKN